MSLANLTNAKVGVPEWELIHDHIEGTYAIRRVEIVGLFDTREAARQYMLDTQADRLAAAVERTQADV